MATSTGYTLVTDTHDGAQGADGQFERTVYQNVEDQPDYPLGGSDTEAPDDWTFDPTESNSQRWKSVAPFNDGNTTTNPEISEITFSGTTADFEQVAATSEKTRIQITGTTSGNPPTAATAEVTELTFAGTSATTVGVAGFSKTASSSTFTFEEIAFGSGGSFPGWVGVGFGGDIFVSTTGADGTWAQSTGTIPEIQANLNDVAYDGVGRWVAVASKRNNSTQVWTATDPAGDWVHAGGGLNGTGIDTIDDEHMNAVIHDGTRWIVVGAEGIILTAVDPTAAAGTTNGWVTHTRGDVDLTRRSFYGIEYVENFDGTTPLYVVVGDDNGGVKQLFYTEDASSSWTGASDWTVNNTHGESFDFVNVKFANDIWIIAADISGASSNIVITTDPRSTNTALWSTVVSGIGSELRDAAYDGTNWYVSSSSSASTYALGTYADPTDPTSTLSWTTGTTGSFTDRARAVEFADNQLVFGTTAGILVLGTGGTIPGSSLTLVGDTTNFPTNGTVTLALGNLLNGGGMRDDVITQINDIVADTMDNRIAGLTASATVSQTERVDLTANDTGIKSNILINIDNGTTGANAVASVSDIPTNGTEVNGAIDEDTTITFSGVAGDPFGGLTDRAPASLNKVQKKVGFGEDGSGNDLWVAVGEREGPTSAGAGTIYTATDPDGTWTRNSTNPVDGAILNDVAYDGTGLWVAVGDAIGGNATIIVTTDATGTWVDTGNTTVPSNPQSIIYVADLSLWVMAGSGIWTSSNGTVWTQRESSGFYFCVEYDADNGLLVAAGNSGVMRSSTDALTWTVRSSGFSARIRAVGYHDGQWMAVGEGSGGLSLSTDGSSWTFFTSGTGLTETLNGVAFAIDRWLVCGASGNIRESIDNGANWTLGLTSPTSLALQWVSYEGEHLIIVGGADNNDGLIFTPTETPTVFTIDGDSSEFTTGSLTTTFPGGSTAVEMSELAFGLVNGNLTGVNIYRLGTQLKIASTTAGTRNDINVPAPEGGTAARQIIRQQGSDGSGTVLTEYTLTAAGTGIHTPATISSSFDGNTTAALALIQIRNHFINNEIGGYTNITTIGSNAFFEVDSVLTGNEDPDLSFEFTQNGTGGNLVRVVTVTDGAESFPDGSPDTFITTINRTEYPGNFSPAANATQQAVDQMTFLNGLTTGLFNVSIPVAGTIRIEASANGNQYDTLATLTRGTPKMGAVDSTADETPTVVKVQDGRSIPDWSTPVQDGFRGTTGVDGARGPGRFSNEFIITVADTVEIRPQISGSRFDTDARAAIVAALGAGANPADGDVVTITYQLTSTDPAVNGTYSTQSGLFDLATISWQSFALTIDGNLLVNGTIVGDKLLAGTVTATQVNLFPQDVGAGVANTGTDGRMVITSDKIEIYDENDVLRVELGDLSS